MAATPPATLPFAVTRAISEPVAARTEGDGMPTMVGHFSTYDEWYEVDSMFEGHFLERIAPGAFDATIAEDRSSIKVLYDHGQDPQIGNKILGTIGELKSDDIGPYSEVALFDTTYNRDLVPGLEAGVYGQSFRFVVREDEWDHKPQTSAWNPSGIPERTITNVKTFEFGPVTFPANPAATAGVRSTTDTFYKRGKDPEQFESLLRSAQVARTPAPVAPASASPTKQETKKVPEEYVTREEKAARVTELESAISRQAVEFPGVMPESAQTQYDADVEERRLLVADIAAWDERTALLKTFAEKGETHIERTAPMQINRKSQGDIYDLGAIRSASRSDEEFRQSLRDNAMRSVESASYPQKDLDPKDAAAQVAKLLDFSDSTDKELALRVLQTGNPVYQRAFSKLVKGQHLTPEEERAAAIAVVGTTTTGGYALPYVFDPTIIHTGAYTNINPYRVVCDVKQIVGGNKWVGVSAGAIAAQYRAEGDAMSEGGPTFAQPTYTAQRADAFVTLSREALQDRPDLATELASLIDEGKATNEESQFSIGVGTTVFPSGMFVKSKFTVKETITDNVFAVADLDATEAALPIRHRAEAIWMLSRAVIRICQGFETAYGKYFNSTLGYPAVGNPALNPGGNTGLSLLGYPVWETPSAPATVTSDDTIVGILVAPKNYVIVDRVGMEVEIVPNMFDATTGFPTGQRGLMAIWRNTAGPVNADAGRQININ